MKKPIKKKSMRETTAYHEAGHAVISYWLRRGFTLVTIKPDKEAGTLGHLRSRKLTGEWIPEVEPERYRNRMEKMVMVDVAGAEAARRVSSCYNWIGASGDVRSAHHTLHFLAEGDLEEIPFYLAWLRHKTKRLLQRPYLWYAVEALAAELLIKETIKAKEAKAIIQRAIQEAVHSGLY